MACYRYWLARWRGRHEAQRLAAAQKAAVQQVDAEQIQAWRSAGACSRPMVDCVLPDLTRLEAGRTYYWCRCGRSRTQPFCDGSHAGSAFEPLAFVPKRSQTYWLCTCKYTRHPPFCDAAHNRLTAFADPR